MGPRPEDWRFGASGCTVFGDTLYTRVHAIQLNTQCVGTQYTTGYTVCGDTMCNRIRSVWGQTKQLNTQCVGTDYTAGYTLLPNYEGVDRVIVGGTPRISVST